MDTDVIVLAMPVYFYSMDAQMKIMIDRHPPFEKAYAMGKTIGAIK